VKWVSSVEIHRDRQIVEPPSVTTALAKSEFTYHPATLALLSETISYNLDYHKSMKSRRENLRNWLKYRLFYKLICILSLFTIILTFHFLLVFREADSIVIEGQNGSKRFMKISDCKELLVRELEKNGEVLCNVTTRGVHYQSVKFRIFKYGESVFLERSFPNDTIKCNYPLASASISKVDPKWGADIIFEHILRNY
jgi:hypothetical protein